MFWRAPLQSVRPDRKFRSRGRKLLLTIAVLGATASIAGLGPFATFTSSTSRLNVDATAIAPGDTIQRSFDLIDQGTLNLASVTLTTTATTSSVLDTDATNGLPVVLY